MLNDATAEALDVAFVTSGISPAFAAYSNVICAGGCVLLSPKQKPCDGLQPVRHWDSNCKERGRYAP